MKIEYIQISNILSFKYYPDVNLAPKILFEDGLNILIGQNGSGKSTVLEVLNFIFKKLIFFPYTTDLDAYSQKTLLTEAHQKKQILQPYVNPRNRTINYDGFRLDPNWDTTANDQKILIKVRLDDIDKGNLNYLESSKHLLTPIADTYSTLGALNFSYKKDAFQIEITLNKTNKSFIYSSDGDEGLQYLIKYNYYRELIDIYNQENTTSQISQLQESFTLIGGYRNYNAFTQTVSLSNEAVKQIQGFRNTEAGKSTNATDAAEPAVFNLVRLRIADIHQNLVFTDKNEEQATEIANQEPFLAAINKKLSLINLKVRIKLERRGSWTYSFNFHDTKTERILTDINSLSAGQKSIIHLIFESYGRGDLKGGVVIIDEPEIHLHYQFQYEYLRIIEQLNFEQKCQYILVTHSEALISSATIDKVKRFTLDENRYTLVKSPSIKTDQKTLIKILDNTRSTYAFFAKKVVLVEGDTDRYFFKSVFQELKPELNQEIAILDIGGKGGYKQWKEFFTGFGLEVYFIGDFDNVFSMDLPGGMISSEAEQAKIRNALKQKRLNDLTTEQKVGLNSHYSELIKDTDFLGKPQLIFWQPLIDYFGNLSKIDRSEVVTELKLQKTDINTKIEAQYANNIFILKKGVLENYLGVSSKSLSIIVPFCEKIKTWLSNTSPYTVEITDIVNKIAN